MVELLKTFTYVTDEVPKKKHKWQHDFAGFVWVRGIPVGKCLAKMSMDEARNLLHDGVYVASDRTWPKSVFAVATSGVVYRFVETVPGNSYHGFPVHGVEWAITVPTEVKTKLEARARDLKCERRMRQWLESTPGRRP